MIEIKLYAVFKKTNKQKTKWLGVWVGPGQSDTDGLLDHELSTMSAM